jgi:hypothetical protein
MQLFCEKCGENHEFTPIEVEHLVYGLNANLADECNSATSHANKTLYGWDDFEPECLNTQLGLAQDCEGYGEHVRQQTTLRYAHEIERNGERVDEITSIVQKIQEVQKS